MSDYEALAKAFKERQAIERDRLRNRKVKLYSETTVNSIFREIMRANTTPADMLRYAQIMRDNDPDA
jgi:hypothetical protein